MKTKTIAVTMLATVFLSCNLHHPMEHWKTEEISSIQVDLQQSDGSTDIITINDKSEIKKVMNFLLQTTFEPYSEESSKEIKLQDQWAIRLIFKGQRDQIFLFKDHALKVSRFISSTKV